jgi:hypothetical protein
MVTPIPTFQSNRTLTPVAPVSFSGDRALAGAFGDVGKVFDQLGNFAERKLYERMEREQTILGQEIASSKGFDHNELPDPRTAADRIYRESALQTYAINVEHDVTTRLNGLYLANHRNPNGFAKSADAYVTSTVDALPPELKNGVSKLAMSMAAQKHFSLLAEQQKTMIAEAEKAERSYIGHLQDQFALSKDGAERQAILNKLEKTIDNSRTYLTKEMKDAVKRETLNGVFVNDVFARATTGDITPIEAVNELRSLGVVPDSTTLNQIYSAANQKINFEENQARVRAGNRQASVQAAAEEQMQAIYDLAATNDKPEFFDIRTAMGAEAIRASGGTIDDVMKFKDAARKVFYGDKKDNENALLVVGQMLHEADPSTPETLKNFFVSGQITPQTYQNKLQEYTKQRSAIRNNPVLGAYVRDELPKYYPLATIESELEVDPLDVGRRQAIASDKDGKRAAIDWIVNRSQEVPMPQAVQEHHNNLRANALPADVEHIMQRHIGKPYQAQIERVYKSPSFNLLSVNERGQGVVYTEKNAPEEYRELLKGKWTRENGLSRVQAMIKEQKKAAEKGQSLYEKELLRALYEDWN